MRILLLKSSGPKLKRSPSNSGILGGQAAAPPCGEVTGDQLYIGECLSAGKEKGVSSAPPGPWVLDADGALGADVIYLLARWLEAVRGQDF